MGARADRLDGAFRIGGGCGDPTVGSHFRGDPSVGSHFRGATPHFEASGEGARSRWWLPENETRRDDRIDSRSNRDLG